MTTPFGSAYADAYDELYADKDYEAECELIVQLAAQHGTAGDHVLDLGCGTGRHAVLLAARGMSVTGVDLSTHMVELARQRAAAAGVPPLNLIVGDARDVRLGETFDIALLMFAVLGYQLTDADVVATLRTAREHLRPGGILVFDVWNGPAVETIGPSSRTKSVERDGGVIERRADGSLDPASQRCTVDYQVSWVRDGTVIRCVEERHEMRYFFADELQALARQAGLGIVASGAFPDFGQPADSSQWNALYVARAE